MHWKLIEQCPPYPIIAKKATQDFLIRDSGSVGRADASYTRGLRFESSHQQKLNITLILSTVLKRQK